MPFFPVGLNIPSYYLASLSAPVPLTGTQNETVLARIAVPANSMGKNGLINIESLWSAGANNANAKTARIYFGSTVGTKYLEVDLANGLSGHYRNIIQNVNNVAVQNGGPVAGVFGAIATAIPTGAINTLLATEIVVTGQLANQADTMTLEDVHVILSPFN